MKKILRNSISSVLFVASKLSGQSVQGTRILCYHKVNNRDSEYLNVPVEQFRSQMQMLKDEGYQSVSLHEILKGELPEKSVAITFDDGYRDNFENAVPILKSLGFTATFFCIEEKIDSELFMTQSQLLEMIQDGFEVGSHTLTHPELIHISVKDRAREIEESRSRLAKRLGTPMNFFCYPRGLYDQQTVELVQKAGYLGAVSNRPGANSFDQIQQDGREPFILKRTEISPADTPEDFKKKMAGAFDPLHQTLHLLRGRP